MKLFALVLFAFVLTASNQSVHATERKSGTSLADQVLAVDAQRTHALINNDAAALDRILALDVTYVTGDGVLNARSNLLSDIRSRKLSYSRLQYQDTSVRLFGSTAILVSRAIVRGRYESTALVYELFVTRVYVRDNGRWLLEAIQSTRTGQH